ncbi:MAG TPA: deoxyribose-phosphate aldolase [Victivallales bacterium]|nr:deoxyribose-phosphate aldolase [Victivallales bacterium]
MINNISEIASLIDHTLLRQNTTRKQIRQLCEDAVKYGFATVCVNPFWVSYCAENLAESRVKICSVVGFPLGATPSEVKAFEAELCIRNGAHEIDMVMNIGSAKDSDWKYVESDISTIAKIARDNKAILKVIFENCLLEKDEILKACEVAVSAGAHFVKTSTGFSSGGATLEDVKLMYEAVKGKCLVKAAGGIRNASDAENMIKNGASRLGTSSGVAIVNEMKTKETY